MNAWHRPSFRYLLAVMFLTLVVGLSSRQATFAQTDAGAPVVLLSIDDPLNATPSGEQVLRLAGPVEGIATLDPALVRDLDTAFVTRQLYGGLTRLNEALEPVPDLADRIDIDAAGLVYRFTLRRDATFQDGRRLVASDVAASFTRALDPATAGGEASLLGGPTYLSDIAGAGELLAGRAKELSGVNVIDDQTIEVTLSAPRATFLMKLAGVSSLIVDRTQAETSGEWWRSPNGSGPFRVLEWVPDDHLTLGRIDDFYGGTPPLERVEMRLGSRAAQPFNLYQADQVDIARVPADAVDRVLDPASPYASELTVSPMFAVSYIAFSTTVEPMDDPHIRRAVQLAFPRDKVASVTLNDHVVRASGIIPHGMLGRQWPAAGEAYDVDAARQEIARSRYGSPERVPPLRIYGGSPSTAAALRDVLGQELGLQVEVVEVDWPEFLDGLALKRFPAYELYWGADYPDPESFLQSLFGSGSSDNYIGYHNPRFDELLRQAAETLDPVERGQLYDAAQRVLLDDDAVLPMYYDVRYMLRKPWVKNATFTALGMLSLDLVWLEH